MAQIVLDENKQYVGGDIAEKAIQEIKQLQKKGEEANEKIEKKTTRGRKRKTVE